MDKEVFNSPFFRFLDPVLKAVDEGLFFKRPFMWLYVILAVLNLLIPIALLVGAIKGGIFELGGTVIFGFILLLIIVCGLSWFGAQIWWNRSAKVLESSEANADFVAIPVFSHFVQTFGEWVGMWIGVGGFCLSLIASIFMASYSYELASMGLGSMTGFGLMGCILNPIYGFIIIVVARVTAELLRALAAIANNTGQAKTHSEPVKKPRAKAVRKEEKPTPEEPAATPETPAE